MTPFEMGYKKFIELATGEGYTQKVVGDYSYRKPRRQRGKYCFIKLISIDRTGENIKVRRFEQ